MNSRLPPDPWSRLAAAARTASDDRDTAAPYGFTTRVAALAFAQDRRGGLLFERFAFRALGASALLALGSVALNYQALAPAAAATPAVATVATVATVAFADDLDTLPADDAVALVLDLGLAD
jgi:hypothetical protein